MLLSLGFTVFLLFTDTVAPSEACLYSQNNWVLAQIHQQSTQAAIHIILVCCTGWDTSKNLDKWRSITSNAFVLNMVKGHHLLLRWHLLLFHIFQLFYIKAAKAHYPIIQKEEDELLAKDAIEPLMGGPGFLPKCICCS